jgi:hypothetical protein
MPGNYKKKQIPTFSRPNVKYSTKLQKSRDAWRKKAIDRKKILRINEKRESRKDKKIRTLEELNQLLEQKNRMLGEQLKEAKSAVVVNLDNARRTRALCVLLVIIGVVSFRSVPRILSIVSGYYGVKISWIPHFTSVINWTLRVGLARLNSVIQIDEPWVALIDVSIDVSIKKALVVLRVKLSTLQEKGRAITLEDCECIDVQVSDTWNGETVSAAIEETFKKAGKPVAILKDGGSDLAKGVRIWRKKTNSKKVVVIEDIGHVAANALKATYSKLTAFIAFLASLKSGAAKLRQSDLAYLTPPKIRTKGRFQSITTVAEWASKILSLLGGPGRPKEGSLADRLRGFMPGISDHRKFIEGFARTAEVVSKVLEILKHQGINQKTYRECRNQLESLPNRCIVKKRLMKWLDKHLRIQCRMGIGQTPLLSSSDVIETLFGKFKVTLQRSNKAEFNRIVLSIPALCGKIDENQINSLLNGVTHEDLKQWETTNIIGSQAKSRREILSPKPKTSGPKTARDLELKVV